MRVPWDLTGEATAGTRRLPRKPAYSQRASASQLRPHRPSDSASIYVPRLILPCRLPVCVLAMPPCGPERPRGPERPQPAPSPPRLSPQGALDLTAKTAYSAMTPLDKVFMRSHQEVLDEDALQEILTSGHSRVPVYANDDR